MWFEREKKVLHSCILSSHIYHSSEIDSPEIPRIMWNVGIDYIEGTKYRMESFETARLLLQNMKGILLQATCNIHKYIHVERNVAPTTTAQWLFKII